MYEHFPLFNAFRVPESWLALTAFALALLAAFRAARTGQGYRTRRRSPLPAARSGGYSEVFSGLLLVLMLLPGALYDFERTGEEAQVTQALLAQQPDISPNDPRLAPAVRGYMDEQRALREDTFRSEMRRSLFFLLLGRRHDSAFSRWVKRPGGRCRPFSFCSWWWTCGASADGISTRTIWSARTPSRSRLPPTTWTTTSSGSRKPPAVRGISACFRWKTGSPFSTCPAHPTITNPSAGTTVRNFVWRRTISTRYMQIRPRVCRTRNALDLLGVRYVIAPAPLPGLDAVYQGEQTGLLVLENRDVPPRAWLVGEVEVANDPPVAWARLRDPAFDLRRTALLYDPLDMDPVPIDSGSIANVRMRAWSPHEIVLDVATDAPRLLVLSEVFYPAGWEATVGGEETSILQVDHLLRGVPVPAGAHEVVLRFDPPRHRIGVAVGAGSTVLVYGGVVMFAGDGLAPQTPAGSFFGAGGMKRLLFVTYYFPPSGGPGVQRSLKFVKYLPEFGWRPTVLTVRPESASWPDPDPDSVAGHSGRDAGGNAPEHGTPMRCMPGCLVGKNRRSYRSGLPERAERLPAAGSRGGSGPTCSCRMHGSAGSRLPRRAHGR